MTGQLWTTAVLGVIAGTDNFQAAAGLGMLPLTARSRWFWILSFGFWEAFMTLVGALAGGAARTHLFGADVAAGTLALVLSGAATLYLAMRGCDSGAVANSRWIAVSTPFLLSLDNLAAGAGLGISGVSAWACAGEIGTICAAMSVAGLSTGAWGRRMLTGHRIGLAPALSGAWMMLAAGAHCWIR